MKWIFSLLFCISASAQLPVIPYVIPTSSGAPPNFLDTLAGAEHHWSFTDLATNTAVGVSVWVDRMPANLTNFWDTTHTRPTNSSLGLVFGGNQGVTNLAVNITGAGSSMSCNDTVNNRLFYFIYSTANANNMNLMSQKNQTRGVVLNSNGTTGNTAGTCYITDPTTFTTQKQLATTSALKTDGSVVCVCFGNTNHPAGAFGMNGYTNGTLSIGFAPAFTGGQPLNCVGDGFNLLNAKIWDIGSFTNSVADATSFFATCASNVNYFRTNFYKVPQ